MDKIRAFLYCRIKSQKGQTPSHEFHKLKKHVAISRRLVLPQFDVNVIRFGFCPIFIFTRLSAIYFILGNDVHGGRFALKSFPPFVLSAFRLLSLVRYFIYCLIRGEEVANVSSLKGVHPGHESDEDSGVKACGASGNS